MDRGEEENDGGSGGRKNREKIEWSCGGGGREQSVVSSEEQERGRSRTTQHNIPSANTCTTSDNKEHPLVHSLFCFIFLTPRTTFGAKILYRKRKSLSVT